MEPAVLNIQYAESALIGNEQPLAKGELHLALTWNDHAVVALELSRMGGDVESKWIWGRRVGGVEGGWKSGEKENAWR